MFTLSFSKQAIKIKAKMPQGIAKRFDAELEAIAANPASFKGDWKPLHGTPFWRLRVRGWRALCEIRGSELIIYVLKIGSRGDVYK